MNKIKILVIVTILCVLSCPIRMWDTNRDLNSTPCSPNDIFIFCNHDKSIGLYIGVYPTYWITNFYDKSTMIDTGVHVRWGYHYKYSCWACQGENQQNAKYIDGNAWVFWAKYVEIGIDYPGYNHLVFNIWEQWEEVDYGASLKQ